MRGWVVILLADGKNLERFQAMLAGTHYELECFTDSRAALAWMERKEFVRAVLVLNDLATPGVSVIPLIRQVRSVLPEVAIVLCTTSRPLAVEAYEAGAFGIVREPAPIGVFLGTLLRAWQSVPLRHPLPFT